MAFIVPLVQRFQGIWKRLARGHALRLFVGNIFRDGAVDVNQVILDAIRQLGGRVQPLLIEGGFEVVCFVGHEAGKNICRFNAVLI